MKKKNVKMLIKESDKMTLMGHILKIDERIKGLRKRRKGYIKRLKALEV